MELEELQSRLPELNKAVLQEFIVDLYLRFPDVMNRIETLTLTNDPSAMTKLISKGIRAVKRAPLR